MIIFGVNTREKAKPAGQFHCPVCETNRTYAVLQRKRYFSLFFLPIIPLGSSDLGRVRCTHCGSEFDPAAIS